MKIHKTLQGTATAVNEAEGIVEAYVNTMGISDADGDVVDPTAFNESIRDNLPIPVLSGHDQGKLVGKVLFAQPEHVAGDEYRLFTRMQMNMDTESGRDAYSNVAGDFIREWSVGFNIPEDSDITHEGSDKAKIVRRIGNLDWVEVSTVIRGASPSTSTVAAKAAGETDLKGAIPSHLTATDENSWDAELMRTRIKGGAGILRSSHAWYDTEGNPESKSSYRFLHHHIGKNGKVGAANTRALTASINSLNGRRISIPETDRRGVYNHLARHLRESGKKPSELRSADIPDNSKPFPNFHACRIREPEDFDRFRTSTEMIDDGPYEGRTIEILYGREKETGDWDIASYRLPLDDWSEDEARKWCEVHDGIKFEPATGEADDRGDVEEAASDTTSEDDVVLDTAERQLRLARARLALHGK
jgi:HK97 family phage prohead protease